MTQEQIEALLHSFESHCDECFEQWTDELGESDKQRILYTLQTTLRSLLELKFNSN